jgi:hypothetical protein
MVQIRRKYLQIGIRRILGEIGPKFGNLGQIAADLKKISEFRCKNGETRQMGILNENMCK